MSEDRADRKPGSAALHHPGDPSHHGYALVSGISAPDVSSWDLVLPDLESVDHFLHIPVCRRSPQGTGRPGVTGEPEPVYDIMVDGSGDGHSIALFPGEEVFFAYEKGASNNDAEFNAVILALENLPPRAHARISTDSQVVVWHLSARHPRRNASYIRKKAQIEDLIACRHLKVEIQWIPRKENRADRFLKHYIASLCGAKGCEPLHRQVRRLESENIRLKSTLKKAMKMLENRPVVFRDGGLRYEMAKVPDIFPDNG